MPASLFAAEQISERLPVPDRFAQRNSRRGNVKNPLARTSRPKAVFPENDQSELSNFTQPSNPKRCRATTGRRPDQSFRVPALDIALAAHPALLVFRLSLRSLCSHQNGMTGFEPKGFMELSKGGCGKTAAQRIETVPMEHQVEHQVGLMLIPVIEQGDRKL
jgi:hypothetical protein